ncbi:fatty acyl-AMP ligase [Marinomonas transparens]|uniref:Fatty acyl-AMP ligase n=1 Tax=Marinomonas transparens TaxID=2795388 RepID=A0A934JWN3_9GAMM|nr:fatty acyl-AMP ligase [Marinomonas transparens]MBJ7539597.1 fatty acyl-AMP ligase [Marinomonas transparens]
METQRFNTWSKVLKKQVALQPDKTVFTFLSEEGSEKRSLSFKELDQAASGLAKELQKTCEPDDRVLLFYPQGLDYVIAFYACIYAGLVAVPLYPPQNNRKIDFISTIAKESGATLALTTAQYKEKLENLGLSESLTKEVSWLSTDDLEFEYDASWPIVERNAEDLVYLQYTSGSTSLPKGVILNNACTLYQSEELSMLWGTSSDSKLVSWLPHFHDLGQVFGILQPIYKGFSCVLISPATFVKRPYIWLEAISEYKATHTAAPDFAFTHSVSSISNEQKKQLDLSSIETVVNGAEPVREKTIDLFYHAFKECGFKSQAHCPSYGMAETTLVVSAQSNVLSPRSITVDPDALKKGRVEDAKPGQNNARSIVSNGKSCLQTDIKIVSPEGNVEQKERRIGEIWITGPGVGLGYWNDEEGSRETFQAKLQSSDDQRSYFRTGDLGFKCNGDLYITGRMKDLIIVRGLDHYPQDIELSVEQCHPILHKGYCAAFSMPVDGEEQLVVAVERERYYSEKVDFSKVIELIRNTVSQEHGLSLYRALILKPGSIPKTTSGKIQRQKCKAELLNNELKTVADLTFPILKSNDQISFVQNLLTSLETAFKRGLTAMAKNLGYGWVKSKVNRTLAKSKL